MVDFEIADTTRLSRPSLAQVKAVVEFIQRHPTLAHRAFRHGDNKKVQELWIELANVANSIKGAAKTTKGWIKYWSDKRRTIMMKKRQINSGKIVGKFTSLEQKILDVIKSRKKKSPKLQQLCNGNDDSVDDNPEDENDLDLVDTNEIEPTEADERHLDIIEKMNDAIKQQAAALAKMAQATLIKSKAMERMAEASHKQAMAVNRIAETFETIGNSVCHCHVRNAVMSNDYTFKKCFTTNSTHQRLNNPFS